MKIDQVAVQLYTLRDHLQSKDSYAESMRKIREIGFRSVQVSGPRPCEPDEIAALCKEVGLVINSSHESPELILNNPEQVVKNLDAFGCKYTAYPFPGGIDFGSKSAVDTLIEGLDRSGKVLAESGKVLTYHNHHMEFRKIDGEIILERIYRATNPDFVQAEIDTYWVQYGGGNPTQWCQKLKGRLPLLHLKDFRIDEENQIVFSEIGNGVLDFPGIIEAAESAGCGWFIVEQDRCPGDPFDSLEMSFRYISDHLIDR
ncbi:MAG: sugar phosphate isomerase/epimerase [Opitutales bacterium]|nr:sugar phosphate isomerase/epimerase [Opitutales bacterium]